MQSNYSTYRRNSCHRHQSNGFLLFIPVFIIMFYTHTWVMFWPLFIIFMLIGVTRNPRSYSASKYKNTDPMFVSKTDYNNNFSSTKTIPMNFCKNCGSHVESDSMFCSECGFKIR